MNTDDTPSITRRRTPSSTTVVGIRLNDAELDALDQLVAQQSDLEMRTRSGLAAAMLVMLLGEEGVLTPRACLNPG